MFQKWNFLLGSAGRPAVKKCGFVHEITRKFGFNTIGDRFHTLWLDNIYCYQLVGWLPDGFEKGPCHNSLKPLIFLNGKPNENT